MPDLSNPTRIKNSRRHKPDCPCGFCVRDTLSRKAKAFDGPTGARGDALEKAFDVNSEELHIDKHTMKSRVKQWALMRLQEPGIKNEEVAKRLGIAKCTLNTYISNARREGWLKFDDPTDKIDFEIIPKVLDNLNHFLDAKDKAVTIETAKGVLWKPYLEAKGIADVPQTILALKIESADPDKVKVITGQIVGAPREIEE